MILIVVVVALVGCKEKEEFDKSEALFERGYLVMGMDDTFAPMGFRDKAGELVGFDVDLAKAVSESMEMEIKLQPIDWSMKETELNSENIDLIWNGYSVTDARKEKVNFSDIYLENKQIILSTKDDIKTKKDLAGKKVAVQNASSSLEAINKEPEILDTFKDGEPVLFDTNHEAFLDLESGRSDAVVADEVLAKYYIRQKDGINFNIAKEDFGEEVYAIGVRKGDKELLNKINETLKTLRDNGKYDEIYNKWFKE